MNSEYFSITARLLGGEFLYGRYNLNDKYRLQSCGHSLSITQCSQYSDKNCGGYDDTMGIVCHLYGMYIAIM